MKKVLSSTLVLIFVMVAASLAISAETTFEGEFRIQSWSEWNFDKKFNNIYDEQYDGWFEQRFRLTVTHTRSEFLKAVVQLDLVEDTWGQGRSMYIDNDNTGEYINWAYLDFTVPEIGRFRVGKFPVTWGHGLIFSQEHPGVDGVEWSRDWGKIATTVLYWKYADPVTFGPTDPFYNRDADLIALHISYTPNDNHLIELYGGYFHFHYFDTGFAGLAYTGNIADMIDIKFEGGYLWGKIYDLSEDIEGYSIYADVSYYNDLFRLGLAFLMVSGDYKSDKQNFPHIWDEAFSWANIVGNDGGGINSVYSGVWWSGDYLENITSLKLYFEICPMDKLTINAAVLYTWTTEKVGPTAFGFGHPADWYSNHIGLTGWDDSSDFGWEVDLGFSYEIMEGLTFTFAGGVLFTGDAWDYDAGTTTRDHEEWGTIWSISNTLLYEF